MTRFLIPSLGATSFALTFASTAVWAQASDPDRYGWGPHMMWWGGGWPAMIFGPLFMILILGVTVGVVVLVVRWLAGPWQRTALSHRSTPGPTALDILKGRFARGEIDKSEFEERRRVLGE